MPRVWQAEPKAGSWHLWASEGIWGRGGGILRAAVYHVLGGPATGPLCLRSDTGHRSG